MSPILARIQDAEIAPWKVKDIIALTCDEAGCDVHCMSIQSSETQCWVASKLSPSRAVLEASQIMTREQVKGHGRTISARKTELTEILIYERPAWLMIKQVWIAVRL